MQSFVIKVIVNSVAIWVATLLVPGVSVNGDDQSLGSKVLTFLIVGLILAIINRFIKPIVTFFAIPFYILTLGLMAFVVNALMLQLVAWLSGKLSLDFEIDDFFWSALGAAVVVTLVSMILNILLPDGDDD